MDHSIEDRESPVLTAMAILVITLAVASLGYGFGYMHGAKQTFLQDAMHTGAEMARPLGGER